LLIEKDLFCARVTGATTLPVTTAISCGDDDGGSEDSPIGDKVMHRPRMQARITLGRSEILIRESGGEC